MKPKYIMMASVFALACGPGEFQETGEEAGELRAAEVCRSFCDVRTTCDPAAISPPAAGCFGTCMELPTITDESPCGLARRELQSCIGELDCEGYGLTMTPNAAGDPCTGAKFRFADLKCGTEVSP